MIIPLIVLAISSSLTDTVAAGFWFIRFWLPLQPFGGGFSFRAIVNQIFIKDQFVPVYPTSYGYAFKNI